MSSSLYVAGEWRTPHASASREIRCPADGTLVRTVSECDAQDAADAVAAASTAWRSGAWSETPERERGRLLERAADLIERDLEQYATAESRDTGKRIVEARLDMQDVIACFRYYATLAGAHPGRLVDTGDPHSRSRVEYAPVGVCSLITPWNYPLLQTAWKVAPALLAGNALVLKPSELTPSTAMLLMETLTEAGLPTGVANLVTGTGAEVGEVLTTHPDVDLVSFTGGLATGRRVMASAAATVKRVALELGGKNPNVVFADADHETALDYALTAIFLHSGQVCSAGARLVIEESLHDVFVDELVARARRIRLGGPFDAAAETGPLISAAHREKVDAYVRAGIAEGAVLRCGGAAPSDPALADGFYYLPTILDGCDGSMSVVHEESFGPVLTVETFRDEEEAVRIANDTPYGLAGAVWTQDAGRAQRVASRLRHGTVWINDYHPYLPQAEWGGFGQSGNGRELGLAGLDEYREARHVYHNLDPRPQHWFAPAGRN
ncbi:aldehyde dehydrogenase family protein [Microbacterium sp. SORGH_AS_0888]|uniref:aldehyde dehydrogenase family protein n=1 Tax=Microbacterium sp. SORGH_AS_0888 TaxID=3041791 RepID=UPI00278521C5|nr:aldehyde dehydrogenase family protein [Microbacterium sp. SORGH_AS_0888]MDQ1130873.1 betaine-aldehyde dehydrogenase [Microbacterium sp. SORGH_AS_0888]